jgi:hypothetical protein
MLKRDREEEVEEVVESLAKYARVEIEIDDEMYVYEMKCVLEETSQVVKSHYNSVLLFSTYDLQRPIPQCPLALDDIINQKEKERCFISPKLLFRVDMKEVDLQQLLNWFSTNQSISHSWLFDLVSNQCFNSNFIMFPICNLSNLLEELHQRQQTEYENYEFHDLFECIQSQDLQSIEQTNSIAISVERVFQCMDSILQFNSTVVSHLKKINQLERKIEIQFNNKFLIRQCFIHDSFAMFHGNRAIGNERLEHLGDAVLDVLCWHYLFFKYEEHLNILMKRFSDMTCNNNLRITSYDLDLTSCILTKVPIEDKHISDTFEAICGKYIVYLFTQY